MLPDNVDQLISHVINTAPITFLVLQGIVHFIFAAAIARDAGQLVKVGRMTYLVSGMTWAFATLIGGVWVAGLYWIMHYSNLARANANSFNKVTSSGI